MAVLGYIPTVKRGLTLAFGVPFLYDFSIKNVFYYRLYQLTKFQCHIFFPSKDIKQNVIKFLFRKLLTSSTKIYLWSSSKAMADMEKKVGKMEIQKTWRMKWAFKINYKHTFFNYLKLVPAIFIKFLFFPPNDSPSKTMKNAF